MKTIDQVIDHIKSRQEDFKLALEENSPDKNNKFIAGASLFITQLLDFINIENTNENN